MCVGDWRIGRLIRSNINYLAAAASATVSVPASMQRVGIEFANGTFASNDLAAVHISTGGSILYYMSNGVGRIRLTMKDDGDMPTRAWTITNGSTSSGNIAIVEYFLPEEVIQAGIEEFKRIMKWPK